MRDVLKRMVSNIVAICEYNIGVNWLLVMYLIEKT